MDSQTALLGNELLEGEKVRLTTFSASDLPSIVEWQNDLSKTLTVGKKPVTSEEWLKAQQENAKYVFGIRLKDDDTLIGVCRIINVMGQAHHGQATIAMGHPHYFSEQSYIADAICAMLRYVFMDVNMNRVYARISSAAEATIGAFEDAGMQIEGRIRQAEYQDNQYFDTVVLGILKREWMEQEGY